MPKGNSLKGLRMKETTPVVGLPAWQSHKTVHADKIDAVGPDKLLLECGGTVNLGETDLSLRIQVSDKKPKVGDYYVEYEDGYRSWSPAEAFEAGYTRA